ncbi:SAV_915 family protein [Micromonospora sp. NPDC048905]|uniref:SAV_915 family protein n=1 Tax=Micromonospora sp. NPDC048905 TaxID=3155494 RepID=UPI0033F7DE65
MIYAVPVRDLPGRLVRTVRTGRSPQGQRLGIAFTRPDLLGAAMGADQQWEELCESALRDMLRPLGIDVIQVDPLLVAPPLDPNSGDRAASSVPARAPVAPAGPWSEAVPVPAAPEPATAQARTKRTASATTWPSVSSVRISTLPSVPAVNG